jgi:hypothetical protein
VRRTPEPEPAGRVLIHLDVPFIDARAADLTLTLGAPPEPALEVLRAGAVELRLLGSSHQALVDGGATLSETVACRPGGAGALPARAREGEYTFQASVERLTPGDYARRAERIVATIAGDGLVAVFPGPADAFTALRAGAGPSWDTWHGYPQSCELVHTRSILERR